MDFIFASFVLGKRIRYGAFNLLKHPTRFCNEFGKDSADQCPISLIHVRWCEFTSEISLLRWRHDSLPGRALARTAQSEIPWNFKHPMEYVIERGPGDKATVCMRAFELSMQIECDPGGRPRSCSR